MAKQCIVRINGKRCTNPAKPGSKSCCQHGRQRRAAKSNGRRTTFVHLDCRVPDLLVELEPLASADVIEIEVRDNSTLVGLPTSQLQMVSFLRNWLNVRDHTLDLLERLTPAHLTPSPLMANTYCAVAAELVRYDLQGGAASHHKRGIVS